MPQYSDAEKTYTVDYPDNWLPLTHEGSPHISLASLTTGGYLKLEAYRFENPEDEMMQPERTLQALLDCERRRWPQIGEPAIRRTHINGAVLASTSFSRTEMKGEEQASDFGHARVWVFRCGKVQLRCLYRCRRDDAGVDDEELDSIIRSVALHDNPHLDATGFVRYYYNLLKRHRPQLVPNPPEGLALTLADGQTVLLEPLYNHYLLTPTRLDNLIEDHMDLLDFCGDDVPDLTNYKQIKPLLFPKMFRASATGAVGPHRIAFWPGLAIGAVVQGAVFTYGVNADRLQNWGVSTLDAIYEDLMDNLYNIPPVAPRGLRNDTGDVEAISYVDHPFSASFVLFEDFYRTTSQNLGVKEFLVGLPDPACASCYRLDNPCFVVQHTAMLRWDYHRSIERLTDTIYLVTGPTQEAIKPYDVLHCCPKQA